MFHPTIFTLLSTTKKAPIPDADAIKQAAWDAIAAIADYGHSVIQTTNGQGGVYKETSLTNLCASGDECMGLKAFGNNKPSPANLLYGGNLSLTPTNALCWWKDEGNTVSLAPRYFDKGNWDRYLRMFNGPPNTSYYESNPGAFSAKTNPTDMYMCVRWIPQINDEGFGGIKVLTNNTEKLSFIDSYTPDITLANGVAYNRYVDSLLRIQTKSDNTWQCWINGVSVGSGSGVAFSTTEEWWGTNSHVLGLHVRYRMWKYGAFTPTEVTTIETNTQTIWPWSTKPSYPLITETFWGDATCFNSTTKTWTPGLGKTTVFSGGNGIAGTHKYTWWYFQGSDTTRFPSADGVLTNIRQIPAAAFISTMGVGNSVDQITMDGVNMMSVPVVWTVDLATTGAAIVANINAFQTAYVAEFRTDTILMHPNGLGCNAYHTNAITISATGFSPTKVDAPRGGSLVRPTYATGHHVFAGHQGDNALQIMWVIYPYDSAGTPGDPLPGRIVNDNIA